MRFVRWLDHGYAVERGRQWGARLEAKNPRLLLGYRVLFGLALLGGAVWVWLDGPDRPREWALVVIGPLGGLAAFALAIDGFLRLRRERRG